MAGISKLSILGRECIIVGYDLLSSYVTKDIITNIPSSTYVAITDKNISILYLSCLREAFAKDARGLERRPRLLEYIISPGEYSKSRSTKAAIEDWMLEQGCTR